jgi:hypothetical protein
MPCFLIINVLSLSRHVMSPSIITCSKQYQQPALPFLLTLEQMRSQYKARERERRFTFMNHIWFNDITYFVLSSNLLFHFHVNVVSQYGLGVYIAVHHHIPLQRRMMIRLFNPTINLPETGKWIFIRANTLKFYLHISIFYHAVTVISYVKCLHLIYSSRLKMTQVSES